MDVGDKSLFFILEVPCQYVKQVKGPLPGQRLSPGDYTIKYIVESGCDELFCCTFNLSVRKPEFTEDDNSIKCTCN